MEWMPIATSAMVAASLALLFRTAAKLADPGNAQRMTDRIQDGQLFFVACVVLLLAGVAWIIRANVAALTAGVPHTGAMYARVTFTGHAFICVSLMGLTLVMDPDATVARLLGAGAGRDTGREERPHE